MTIENSVVNLTANHTKQLDRYISWGRDLNGGRQSLWASGDLHSSKDFPPNSRIEIYEDTKIYEVKEWPGNESYSYIIIYNTLKIRKLILGDKPRYSNTKWSYYEILFYDWEDNSGMLEKSYFDLMGAAQIHVWNWDVVQAFLMVNSQWTL
jgi:hypothetical protein